jgi:hypothetical protein
MRCMMVIDLLCLWLQRRSNIWDFHNETHEGNTGFVYVRSNNNTLRLWHLYAEYAVQFKDIDDQTIFWKLIRSGPDIPITSVGQCDRQQQANIIPSPSSTIVTCHLDGCLFSAGSISYHKNHGSGYGMMAEAVFKMRETNPAVKAVSIHANYISGNRNKMESLKSHGLWITSPSATEDLSFGGLCRNFTPMF